VRVRALLHGYTDWKHTSLGGRRISAPESYTTFIRVIFSSFSPCKSVLVLSSDCPFKSELYFMDTLAGNTHRWVCLIRSSYCPCKSVLVLSSDCPFKGVLNFRKTLIWKIYFRFRENFLTKIDENSGNFRKICYFHYIF
jgi:hypothetical protein